MMKLSTFEDKNVHKYFIRLLMSKPIAGNVIKIRPYLLQENLEIFPLVSHYVTQRQRL